MAVLGLIGILAVAATPAPAAVIGGPGQAHKSAGQHVRGAPKSSVRATVGFAFEIKDLVTNHQFAGQKNRFHVSYTYARVMAGGGFDPAGHKVSADVYPYFQQVRDGMISYAVHYKPSGDFYELYGYNIASHVIRSYPQIKSIVLDIDVPAYAQVTFDRSVHIELSRG